MSMYLSSDEVNALKALDVRELENAVDKALDSRSTSPLYGVSLSRCGSYVSLKRQHYMRDLERHAAAKSQKKRDETWKSAWKAGDDLKFAVRRSIERAKEQEKETELYRVDEAAHAPITFSEKLSARISYQWRESTDQSWQFGSITFVHNVDLSPDFRYPERRQNLSRAKAEQQRQAKLYGHWETLVRGAKHSVREFLKSGGRGDMIPEIFEAKPSAGDRYLNNFSCDFWRTDD